MSWLSLLSADFFFNDTATTEIYTLSLHDALPICRSTPASRWGGPRARRPRPAAPAAAGRTARDRGRRPAGRPATAPRSEEHTSELQSRQYLVCRLLLEKKKHIMSLQYYQLTVTYY